MPSFEEVLDQLAEIHDREIARLVETKVNSIQLFVAIQSDFKGQARPQELSAGWLRDAPSWKGK